MRLLVVSKPPQVRRLSHVFAGMLADGHELVFNIAPPSLPPRVREHPGSSSIELPLIRTGSDASGVYLLRATADFLRFLRPEFRDAEWPRFRSLRRVLMLAGFGDSKPLAHEWAPRVQAPPEVVRRLEMALRQVELLIPAPLELEHEVARVQPDGVMIISRCALGAPDADVIKTARSLGLPSIMYVASWDNLSNKAILNEHPDRMIVWNDVQVREATEMHGLPRERVLRFGAPNFDRFFEEIEGLRREQVEAHGGTPTILYLGSSPKIAPRECEIFERWLAAVRASSDPLVRDAQVVLRPHRSAAARWRRWTPPADGLLEVGDVSEHAQPEKLSKALAEADAAVALNTSAEIEAAIAGVPVLTFRAGPDARGQEGSPHFEYLLEESGGFVIDSADLEEHVKRLGAVLGGEHDRERMSRFVEHFVRPAGISEPVIPVLSAAIPDLMRTIAGEPARDRSAPRQQRPAARRANGRTRLLVVSPPALIRHVPDVFGELLDAGAELVFTAKRLEKLKLPVELLDHPRVELAALPLRRPGEAGDSVAVVRAIADLTRFLAPDLPDLDWPRIRAARRLLKLVGHEFAVTAARFAQLRLRREVYRQLTVSLRELERVLPPPPCLEEDINALGVDGILLLTRCSLGGVEPEAIKAARKLGLPTTMLTWSWDNLSSKAVLNEHPDRLLVWNETQAAEAASLHAVERTRIAVVGAANFDRFFAKARPPSGRLQAAGPPRILYLGSSENVVRNEPAVFERWLAAVRSADDPTVREAEIVVRPHPGGRAWRSWQPPDELVRLVPARKIEHRALAQLLADSDAIVALNTSAEIEAAIAGRPVLTFRAGQDAPGQEGSLHFSYLLEQNGGFVLDAQTLDEHLVKLGAVLRGDYDAEPIGRFVERFVRPLDLAQPVSPGVAAAVLDLAKWRAAVAS